jgi:hypothetical protein
MKVVDFSPVNENMLVKVNYNILQIYEYNNMNYEVSMIYDNDHFKFVSFTYNAQHLVFLQYMHDGHTISIVPFDDLHNDINLEDIVVFHFLTDHEIIDFVLSPNKDQIAILFTCNVSFKDNLYGNVYIDEENAYVKYFLRVYDFSIYDDTSHNFRLVLDIMFDNEIKLSFSAFDKIAIYENRGEDNYVISIYDLMTNEIIMHKNFDYRIQYMQYFPESEQYHNTLCLITIDPHEFNKHIRIINVEDDFSQVFIKNLEPLQYLSIGIGSNGEIGLGTLNGLLYFPSPHENPIIKFENKIIQNTVFSRSGQKVAIASQEFHRISETHYYNVKVFNYRDDEEITIDIEREEEEEEEEEEEIVIYDPELDTHFIPPTNPQKLQLYGNQNCFDVIQMNEENIGQYLSADRDNIVIFYKQPTDVGFLATCLTFTNLKKYLTDPKMVFYECIDQVPKKDPRTYYTQPPEFLKIPTQSHTIFLNYNDIKQKYIQRQNMIFLEFDNRVLKTMSYDASITMNFVSSNHCQEGSVINVYRIIF